MFNNIVELTRDGKEALENITLILFIHLSLEMLHLTHLTKLTFSEDCLHNLKTITHYLTLHI